MNLNEEEEKILKYWKENHINDKVREKNRNGKPFYFLDGPPYVSGDLHPGQIWVKTMKDLFIRYRRFMGYNVFDHAGYDVHGLPIENRVEKQLELKSKKEIESKIGVDNFVAKCREYVNQFIDKMNADYERFGVSLDFANAYVPYRNEYIEKGWRILKQANEKGLMYEDNKTTAYCPHCETVLSQGTLEVEYGDETDPSIYVSFKVDVKRSRAKIEVDDDTYLLIWTTTPWTIVSNIAIAANPKALYVLARVGERKYIIAKELFDRVVAAINQNAEVISEFYGSELDGLRYLHPLENFIPKQKEFRKYHRVVMSEATVILDEGTGLVHTAPGHGLEDYLIGKKNKLPIFSPITKDARYSDDAGKYKGIAVPDEANKVLIADLQSAGALIASMSITHSYPHCWRCGSKLIYVATNQYFLNISKIKKKLVSENRKVAWHPPEAQKWEEDVLNNSPDWCISRQRYWGIPLPIWKCEKCGTATVVGSLEELKEKAADKEYANSLKDLHRPYIDGVVLKCEKCGGDMRRISDVADVWFDSSTAFRASLSDDEFDKFFPADFILEGVDQLRGWFTGLLKLGVVAYGKRPFEHVIIDGMMLAEDGREMHKHLGNFISIKELLSISSADAFRLWVMSHTHWIDLPFVKSELKEAEGVISTLYNIRNLIDEYSAAIGYMPNNSKLKKRFNAGRYDIEEQWIMSRLNSTIKKVTESLEDYDASGAVNALRKFILDDFSRFYLKSAKKRILESRKREAVKIIEVIRTVFYKFLVAASPAIPMTAENIYMEEYKGESIFLEDWPKYDRKSINEELESEMNISSAFITAILNSREKAGIKLRWPVGKAVIEVGDENVYATVEKMSSLIERYTNVKKIEVKLGDVRVEEVVPVYAKLGPLFKQNAQAVAEALKKADPEEVRRGIDETGYYIAHTDAGAFDVPPEAFTILKKRIDSNATSTEYGNVEIDTNLTAELKSEALVREFERRIQMIRKNMGLKKGDRIRIGLSASDELVNIVLGNSKEIKEYVGASEISKGLDEKARIEELDISGEKARVSIAKE
ncbi:MAG: isoleucine--tRNA ligase [Candidatus Micrarchaeia archaeon]